MDCRAAELSEALGVKIEGPHTEDQFLLDTLPQSGAQYGMIEARTVTRELAINHCAW